MYNIRNHRVHGPESTGAAVRRGTSSRYESSYVCILDGILSFGFKSGAIEHKILGSFLGPRGGLALEFAFIPWTQNKKRGFGNGLLMTFLLHEKKLVFGVFDILEGVLFQAVRS